MALFLAGQRLTADLLNDNSVEETATTGLVAATNFTTLSFSGRRVNGLTTVNIFVSRTTGSIAGSDTGNIGDTAMCTLPVGWRPDEDINATWGNGFNDGECTITPTGLVTLRSTSGTDGVGVGTNVRVTTNWINA